MNPIPPQLKGFAIQRLLGRGGMATVWLARQEALDRDVAIKVLDPEMSNDPDDVKHFIVEARLTAKLNHVNLVRVFDVACQSGVYFYVMEFARGYDTGKWLKEKGRIDAMEALSVAESIAVALEYAWMQAGLIHCDIKPENIMVDADGTVKLTDLGVARCLRGHAGDEAGNEITGTPAYMAPEQVSGASPLDCRTDMYSLGATLYHLVTGQRLFPSLPDDDLMAMQCNGQAPDARTLVPDLPEPYVALLEKFLAKDPAFRPRNWHAALNDMRQVRQGRLPIGRPPPTGGSTMFRHTPSARLIEDADEPAKPPAATNRPRPRTRRGPSKPKRAPHWLVALLAVFVFLAGFGLVLMLLWALARG